jgi:Na+-transporting methylmalonyl-CoA/oxaloacetate decarboxylase gamma subunit
MAAVAVALGIRLAVLSLLVLVALAGAGLVVTLVHQPLELQTPEEAQGEARQVVREQQAAPVLSLSVTQTFTQL